LDKLRTEAQSLELLRTGEWSRRDGPSDDDDDDDDDEDDDNDDDVDADADADADADRASPMPNSFCSCGKSMPFLRELSTLHPSGPRGSKSSVDGAGVSAGNGVLLTTHAPSKRRKGR
jgi:hypothetical protein